MMFKNLTMISAKSDRSLILEFTSGTCILKTRHRFNWPLPHSKETESRSGLSKIMRKDLYLDLEQ